MSSITTELLSYLNIVGIVLSICVVVGGFSGFRNGRQAKLTQLQKETIDTLEQRVKTLEGKANDLEKENIVQRHIIETITVALKQRGMVITIDGDLVTIQDSKGVSTHRKRTTTTQHSATVIKKEEE